MLVQETTHDVETSTGTMRVFVVQPNVAAFPNARFPGVVVFSEIYNVSAPVARFGQSIAAQGFVVAMPTVFHEFEADVLPYDNSGTDRGNELKLKKVLSATDDDCSKTFDLLESLPSCNGRLAATGMCYGGHLAFRASFDPRCRAAICFFATDIHSESLSPSGSDSLKRAAEIKGEVAMIFGVQDTHVPLEGRSKIRSRCHELGFPFTFIEVQAQHAFIRDTSSKGRYDGALTGVCFALLLEVFGRTIVHDMGPKKTEVAAPEHVC